MVEKGNSTTKQGPSTEQGIVTHSALMTLSSLTVRQIVRVGCQTQMIKVITWALASMAVVAQKWTFGKPTAWQQPIHPTLVIWGTLVKSLRNTDVPGLIVVTITKGSATKAFVIRTVAT